MFIINTCNPWHEFSSFERIGTARKIETAIKKIKKFIKENGYSELNEDDLYNLSSIKQTQNYVEDFEFYIEEV